MLEKYSPQAVKLIECAEDVAFKENKKLIGTEHLLIAMYEAEDTICHFLLSEEQITREELLEEANFINNDSKILEKSKFTIKFNEIVKKANEATKIFNTQYVYDEHIFYTLLNDQDNNATRILINLGVDPKEMIEDILDIFNVSQKEEEIIDFLTNLTTLEEVHPFIERDNQLTKINTILNKKQKNNPMLIGSAGVGKTALIEGYAKRYKEVPIYRFELGGVVANTKYRGELEEKIIKAMNFIKEQKAILFIDEIHNIVGAGSNEGTLDIANILKPYLARNDIRCIGATTLDEYYKYIDKDKALTRRFHNVFIDEATTLEVKNILNKIKYAYEEYHHVLFDEDVISYIVLKTDQLMPNRAFPDKAIDVMDELGVLLTNSNENIYTLIDQIIKELSGISFNYNSNITLNYEILNKYYENYINTLTPNKPIVCIEASASFDINLLMEDLMKISSFKKDHFLELDLENYYEQTSLNTLIGSAKGYVGYESGGILTEQLVKYPYSLIYVTNFDKAHFLIQNFIKKMIKNNSLVDNKGRKIMLNNTIIVIKDNKKSKKKVGIMSSNKENNKIIDFDVLI